MTFKINTFSVLFRILHRLSVLFSFSFWNVCVRKKLIEMHIVADFDACMIILGMCVYVETYPHRNHFHLPHHIFMIESINTFVQSFLSMQMSKCDTIKIGIVQHLITPRSQPNDTNREIGDGVSKKISWNKISNGIYILFTIVFYMFKQKANLHISNFEFQRKFHRCTLLVKNRMYSIFALLHITYCNVAAYIFRNAKHYNKHSVVFLLLSTTFEFSFLWSMLSAFLWQYHKIELLDFRIRSYSYTTANKRAKLFQL